MPVFTIHVRVSLKEMLEEEKAAVDEEAEVVQTGFAETMARLIEHQKQLCKHTHLH